MSNRPFTADELTFLRRIRTEVGRTMFGLDAVVSALLIALISGGHVLLEGNPGLGKTALVRALGRAIGLRPDAVGRIQFTPDLMPSDITGTRMPRSDDLRQLEFQPGPIFRQLLIADEINRATPKTQSAMLEAMAERQVTVLGQTYPLVHWSTPRFEAADVSVRSPFMVMATQNPIDLEGTYDLPEAQSDRFMFKIRMPFPASDVLARIVDKEMQPEPPGTTQAPSEDDAAALVRLHRSANALRSARPTPVVQQHILNVVLASNRDLGALVGVPRARVAELDRFVRDRVEFPLGPRAAVALSFASVGWDAVRIADVDAGEDVGKNARIGLAHVVQPVLRHRLKLLPTYTSGAEGVGAQADLDDADIAWFVRSCAPEAQDYHAAFAAALDEAAQDTI